MFELAEKDDEARFERLFATNPARPEVHAEPRFQFGDGFQIGPGTSLKDGDNCRVRYTGIASSGSDALIAYRGLDILSEAACHFEDGIYRWNVRPITGAVARLRA